MCYDCVLGLIALLCFGGFAGDLNLVWVGAGMDSSWRLVWVCADLVLLRV